MGDDGDRVGPQEDLQPGEGRLVEFLTGRLERLPDPARPLRYGVALAPDGRRLLYAQAGLQASGIMLAEDFR